MTAAFTNDNVSRTAEMSPITAILEAEADIDAAFVAQRPVGSERTEVTYTPIDFIYRQVASVHAYRVSAHHPGLRVDGGRPRTAVATEFVATTERPLDPAERQVAQHLVRHGVSGNVDPDAFHILVAAWVASLRLANIVA